MPHQHLDTLGIVHVPQALEAADADMAVRQPDKHRRTRRRRLVMALQRLASLDHRECLRRVHAQRLEHLGGENFPHRALQRQPPVCCTGKGRLARPFCAKVQNPPVCRPHLGEEEATAIANFRVIHTKLVAVIAQGQRFGKITIKRRKLAEMMDPVFI